MGTEDNHRPTILPRAVVPLLDVALRTVRVVVICGPRQAGKSTLATNHAKLASRPYFSLDDDAILHRMQADRRAFLNSAPEMVIDEVQRDPPLILAIKVAVDQQRPQKRGQFVLTGSANLLMMKHVSDSLAGRAHYLNLQTLTRREQQGLGTAGIWTRFFETPVTDWLDMVRAEGTHTTHHESWQAAVKRGGFPAVALENHDEQQRSLWFDGYLATYLERDLRDLHAVANLQSFRVLMQAAALRIGNLLNHAELGRDAKMPLTTVHQYMGLLETSFQATRLLPYARNRTKRLIKTPKLYWNDVGLGLHLGGGEPTGAHLENYVLTDLLCWRDTETPRPEVTYWRTAAGAEVDFVIERKRKLLAVEVKAGSAPGPRDAAHLKTFHAEYPTESRGGVILHGGDESYWLGDNILAVPWWRVM